MKVTIFLQSRTTIIESSNNNDRVTIDSFHCECHPNLSKCDEGLLINGGLFDQLLVLSLQILDSRAGVPEEDHLLAHVAVLFLQGGDPLVVVIQLGVTNLSLLPQPLVLLLKKLLVLFQLRTLLLQSLVLGQKQ